MRIRPDVEDIQTTRTEKLLAVLLAAFLLLGGIWTYQKIDDVVRSHVAVPSFAAPGPASQRHQEAQTRASQASAQRQRALENLELRREAYRTALDAGQSAAALRGEYEAAQNEFVAAERELSDAQQAVSATRPAAVAEQAAAAERVAGPTTGSSVIRSSRGSASSASGSPAPTAYLPGAASEHRAGSPSPGR